MTALQHPARIEHDGNQPYGAQTYGAEPRLGLRDLVKVRPAPTLDHRRHGGGHDARKRVLGLLPDAALHGILGGLDRAAHDAHPEYPSPDRAGAPGSHHDRDRGQAARLALLCALRDRSARPARRSGLQSGAARPAGEGDGSAVAGRPRKAPTGSSRDYIQPLASVAADVLAGRDRSRAVDDADALRPILSRRRPPSRVRSTPCSTVSRSSSPATSM